MAKNIKTAKYVRMSKGAATMADLAEKARQVRVMLAVDIAASEKDGLAAVRTMFAVQAKLRKLDARNAARDEAAKEKAAKLAAKKAARDNRDAERENARLQLALLGGKKVETAPAPVQEPDMDKVAEAVNDSLRKAEVEQVDVRREKAERHKPSHEKDLASAVELVGEKKERIFQDAWTQAIQEGKWRDSLRSFRAHDAIVEFTEIGVGAKLGQFGESRNAENGRSQITETVKKSCLAGYIPGLVDATRVIYTPVKSFEGHDLENDERVFAMTQVLGDDLPLTTQSSLKGGTVYAVKPEVAKKVFGCFGDAAKIAAYGGLLFSETISAPVVLPGKVEKATLGKEGDEVVMVGTFPTWWWRGQQSGQFRAFLLRKGETLETMTSPLAIAKGTYRQATEDVTPGLHINDTQVKLWDTSVSATNIGLEGDWVIAPCNVTSRKSKVYIGIMPLMQLKDTPIVRQVLAQRTKKAVSEIVDMVREENRVKLCKRLGALRMDENGNLEQSRRGILDMLLSKMPWGQEMEKRLLRFSLKQIVEDIIPSAGITGYMAPLQIDNSRGAKVVPLSEAKCIAFRTPCLDSLNIVGLDRDPFKNGLGMIITEEAKALTDGDGDGDYLVVIYDREIVGLFAGNINSELVGGLKLSKVKVAKPWTKIAELQADLLEYIEENWGRNWQVGTATLRTWQATVLHEYDLASKFAFAAKTAPMMAKWNIDVPEGGSMVPFDQWLGALCSSYKDLSKIALMWRFIQEESEGMSSPRDLVSYAFEAEKDSHFTNHMVAAGLEAVKEWDKANPLERVKYVELRKLAFQACGGKFPTAEDWFQARIIISEWGRYWSERPNGSKHPIFDKVHEWGAKANPGALVALLLWKPKNPESDGFALKFHAVFETGRGTEVLGYHEAIMAYISTERGVLNSLIHERLAEALVEALF